jgi:hypothetical protein
MAEELAIKRLKYFNHQFLRVEDFQEEQDYHLKMRRRLNRVLHTWGVAEGLQVTAAAGATAVKVSAGTAIDEQGREIVLLTDRTEPLGTSGPGTAYVTLRYLEEPTDETDETGTQLEARRWTERAEVRVSATPPERLGEVLVLARVQLNASGAVASVDDGDVANRRRFSGVVGGDLEVRSLAFLKEGRPSGDFPLMRYGAIRRADLTGSLRVTQDATVEGTLAVTGDSTLGGKVAVGIGTVAPKTALHVPEAGIQIGASTTAANNFHFVSDEVPANAPRALRLYGGNYGSGTHLLSVTAAGRVGIGVASPGAPLHVQGRVISAAAAGAPGGFSLIPNDPSAWFHIDHPGGNRMRFSHGGEPGGTELMTITGNGRVGIGTNDPVAKLQVKGGAIMPSAGNDSSSGIMFPENPGDGTGDAAWIRYYARSGESTTLEIGTSNDPDDHIVLITPGAVGIGTKIPQGGKLDVAGDVLMGGAKGSKFTFHTRAPQGGDVLYIAPDNAAGEWQWGRALMYRRDNGNLGIGGVDPVNEKLVVNGSVRMLADGNPLKFTSLWSGHADATKAEISNDIADHKTLMLVGNSSGGLGRRVSVWDRLEVNGSYALNTEHGSFVMEAMSGVTHINNTYVLRPSSNKQGSIGHPNYLVRNIYVWDLFRSYTYDNSDLRVKENFRPLESPLDSLMRLNGRMYDMKPEFATGPEDRLKNNLGFVAQEVGEVFPQLMVYEKESDRYYLNYNGIIPVLVEAVKELKTGVDQSGDARDREIRALREAQAELAARLAALEGRPARVG